MNRRSFPASLAALAAAPLAAVTAAKWLAEKATPARMTFRNGSSITATHMDDHSVDALTYALANNNDWTIQGDYHYAVHRDWLSQAIQEQLERGSAR